MVKYYQNRRIYMGKEVLKSEEKDRRKMMEEATSSLENYSYRIIELENKIKEYELQEIKYKNTERENKELNKIYEIKLEEKNNLLEIKEKENIELKKENTENKTIINNLKSLLEVIVNHYDIEEIANITGLEINKIKEYLK